MQESVFAIVIVFFFLLPLDAVSAQKGFAVNRAFDGIFLALFIEKYSNPVTRPVSFWVCFLGFMMKDFPFVG